MTAGLLPPVVHRALRMGPEEWRARAVAELRKHGGRVKFAAVKPRWRREHLRRILVPGAAEDTRPLRACLDAAAGRNWLEAHRSLARHFAGRPRLFAVAPSDIPAIAASIRARFPDAPGDAAARGARVLDGRYEVLGYRGVRFGTPPKWSFDPVHGRKAPDAFWSDVPYLDPACGDHKIIWELNRHQHWLHLARAFHLTGDRRFYRRFVAELRDWIAANPPLRGVNWASMLEIAFRSISWIWALHLFAQAAAEDPDDETPWLVDLLVALDRQLVHVEQNLSRYFSPNTHLTGEALALYVAGQTLPELRGAAARAATGRALLLEEATRQVRADGSHAELSAHYHRYSTDFYLFAAVVARASGDRAADTLLDAARRQALFLRALADNRGRLPLLGDDDGGQLFPMCGRPPSDCADTLAVAAAVTGDASLAVSDAPEEALWLLPALGARLPGGAAAAPVVDWPSAAFAESGYCVSRRGDSHLVLDAGPHGFLNGGHAHADALSLVLTTAGRPLLVDPGTATYTMNPALRDRFRSTAMHNTVVLAGRSQSDPDGPFHWRTRTDARLTRWHTSSAFDYAEGMHDGYAPVRHVRGVLSVHGLGWFVIDHLLGSGEASAEWFWHLHPDWRVSLAAGTSVVLQHADGTRQSIGTSSTIEQLADTGAAALACWAPEYGRVEPAPVLRASARVQLPHTSVTFIPAEGAATPTRVRQVPLATGPPGHHAAAFVVSWEREAHLLVATSSDPTAAETSLAHWGTTVAQTDGRVALFLDGSPVAALSDSSRHDDPFHSL